MSFKIAVIGDYMVDKYLNYSCERVSPEAPIPVLRYLEEVSYLGGAGNLARNIAEFSEVELSCFGTVGNDTEGSWVVDTLEKCNVKSFLELREDRCTITKKRLGVSGHQICRIDNDSVSSSYDFLPNDKFDAIIVSDYDKRTFGDIRNCVASSLRHGKKVFVDPKQTCFEVFRGVYCLKPNLKEFQDATKKTDNIDELISLARSILCDYDIENIVITLGSRGSLHVGLLSECLVPAEKVSVHNLTGAGDTMLASIVYANLNEFGWMQTLKFANECAKRVISCTNTAYVAAPELEEIFNRLI